MPRSNQATPGLLASMANKIKTVRARVVAGARRAFRRRRKTPKTVTETIVAKDDIDTQTVVNQTPLLINPLKGTSECKFRSKVSMYAYNSC